MFDKEKITRRTNLESGDSLSAYMGMTCQQNPHAFEVFYELLEKVKPTKILEIGTSLGGFTQFLKHVVDKLNISTTIRSYDIYDRYEYILMKEDGIDVRVENIFSNTYKELTNQEVIDFVKGDGVTLVLCDGGSKIDEFNIFSQYIKRGDIIMAHDYASSRDSFINDIQGKFWNWHEISDSDIEKSVQENNLKKFMQDEFTKSVWVCKIKE
jgi:predicted O-methyltransferase YrrM